MIITLVDNLGFLFSQRIKLALNAYMVEFCISFSRYENNFEIARSRQRIPRLEILIEGEIRGNAETEKHEVVTKQLQKDHCIGVLATS